MELERLHAVVPATEEEDLLEEVRRERLAAEAERLLALPGPPVTEPEPVQEDEPEPPFSEPQVLGMLEHHLGAQVVDEDPGAG